MSKLNNSAKRYVKKVSANPEMSHNKLISRIASGSSVLEFGPASGAMTEVLCNEKACKVVIVELDKDCFAHAMKYASDGICCDIETYEWADKLSGQTFDYIVFADVLEHLRNPEKVLEIVKNYLKADGSVLVSVPNIAHNSVIIQMLKNHFIYQNTGILDHTHIKHFTYSELETMCINSGYGVVYMDGVYIAVGKNEFDISYADVEPEIARMLKKRPLGELYQHIVEIKKKEYLEEFPQKIENRLGNRKDFTVLCEERREVISTDEELTNEKVIRILCENPNYFFETNDEIGDLRTQLNEVYAAQENLEEVVKLRTRIQQYQEEVRTKNKHIQELLLEEDRNSQRIIELQTEEASRNEHIGKLDEEVAQRDSLIQQYQHSEEELHLQIKELEKRIIVLQRAEEERNIHIQKLDTEIKTKDTRIVQLQQGEEERNSHIKKLDDEITQLSSSLEDKIREINELMENEQWKTEIGKDYIATLKQNILELQQAIAEREQKIATLQENLAEKNEKITELRVELEQQRNETILNQKEELFQRNVQMTELQNALKKSEEEQKKLEERLAQLIAENQSLQKAYEEISATQQDTAFVAELQEQLEKVCIEKQNIHEYGERINDEKDRLKERVAELEQELRNKQGHIDLLLESDRELERLKAQEEKRLINRIFPKMSKRRLFAKLAWKCVRHPFRTIKMIFTKGKVKNFFRFLKRDGVVFVDTLIDDNYRGNAVKKQDVVVSKVERTKDISEYLPLTFVKQKKPQVSIVIPVYNQFEYTYNCLKSILNNSGEITYEIIIANDCSTDLTTRISEVVKNIKVITNKENLRFLKNCNNAAKHATGKYILFLNNDTQVQPNWLAPLVELIERDEKIGMVGSKLVYADGKLQEAGGILWKDGSAWNYGNRRDPEDPEFNYVKEADYISGAAIMIKADLWNEVGGFDETFAPAYCEDSDLAFEVRKHGYKVMYQPLSLVVHFEGVSNGTDTNSGQKAYQVINSKKFCEKWKEVLEAEHFPNAENVFVARDRNRNKPTLLMVDHYVPQYDKDAGSRTVFQYVRLFVKQGYNVKFIGDNYFKHEPYTTVLQQMSVEVLYGPYYANNWENWIKENAEHFDYVFLNRPHISVKYIDFIRKHTKARIIYYGHDLHFLREKRRYELEQDPQALKDSKEWKQKEIALMKQADVAYYPSSIEVKEIAKIDASIKAKAIVAYMFEDVNTEPYDFKKRKDIMFVGGFTHKPNADAVLWFVRDILPMILDKIPDLKFYIMGSNPPESILGLANDNIIVKGFVTDEELEWHYQNCRISVVPLRYGAGIKGKVVEAMRYGMPVVTTSVGAEGITGAENILCIGNKPKAIARDLVELYNDKNALQEMSERSYEYIKKNFSMESAWSVIEEDFK